LGEVLTTASRENVPVMNYSQYEMLPLEIKQSEGELLPRSFLRGGGVFPEGVSRSFKKRKRDIVVGTWNVRSLYRAGSLTAAARELAGNKLDLVGVQEVRWGKEDTRAGSVSKVEKGHSVRYMEC
jgi:hypothetical protein